MPYQPLGPVVRRALATLAGPDPFDQNALYRLFQKAPGLLNSHTRQALTRAASMDAQAPGLVPDHGATS